LDGGWNVATGVTGLDQVLGGGLPRRQTLVITGEPGATSEPHDKMVQAL
jgi:KaiC/GvpD/RAD55 family RecA-like ATPase